MGAQVQEEVAILAGTVALGRLAGGVQQVWWLLRSSMLLLGQEGLGRAGGQAARGGHLLRVPPFIFLTKPPPAGTGR